MSKIGVVVSNLGTPKSPHPDDVGKYLSEFLMDPYVIQIPHFFRFLLVRGIIAPFRKKKSAKNYQKVWTKEGSPLFVETVKTAKALQNLLGDAYQVVVGMRYGDPSFKNCQEQLKDCEKIIFFPQYPQYAESTFQTGIEHFYKFFAKDQVRVIEPYYEDPHFLRAYGIFLKDKMKSVKRDHLLMSFHGLPESHLEKTDPTNQHCLKSSDCCEKASGDILKTCYRAQCYRTAHGIAKELGLSRTDYSVSFQSRLGRQKWIEPYTEDRYGTLVEQGVRHLTVICPGFPVDGLETLEEIAMTGRQTFLDQGGESFTYLPCLNDDPNWIQACVEMIKNG